MNTARLLASLLIISIPHSGHGGSRSGRADPQSPIGVSQQYATQQSAPNKIYYVEGGWHICFRFSVEATEPQFQQEFLSIKIRVCPAALLEHVRLTHTLKLGLWLPPLRIESRCAILLQRNKFCWGRTAELHIVEIHQLEIEDLLYQTCFPRSPEEKFLLSFLRGLPADTGEASHAGWLRY